MLSSWLAFVACLLFASAAVDATTYVYDANGRLVTVTNDNGESARYVYDVMGNMVRIERIAADELKIFAFTPTHGTVEAPVTIYGQGFSSQISDNTVTFNGTVATIQSATANQLKVTVPFGATTGALAVKVAARSVTADDVFTVDDTGLPPTIASVAPDTIMAGAALTISGAHLYPIPGKTSARVGGRSLNISRSTNASLGIDLPLSASSGRVAVQTPYGFAESVNTVLVVPPGIDPAKINSRGVATMDVSPVALSITALGGSAALMFESRGKQWVSLQLSGLVMSAVNLGYKVYGPGNVLITQGTLVPATPTIHLPRLHSVGTYLVIFTPPTGVASFTAGVESNGVLSDVPSTIATHAPSQSIRATFDATQGQTLVFKVSGATTSPANGSVGYAVYTANGALFANSSFASAGSLNLPEIPAGGAWQVVAWPGQGYMGAMQLSVVKGATGTLIPEASVAHFDAVASKQNVYLDFDAESLGNYELTVANTRLIGTTQTAYYVNVFGPAGNQITSNSCYTYNASGGCATHLWYLTKGHYRVIVQPTYDGELHFDAVLRAHKVGRVLQPDSPLDVQLGLGEAERLTFTATAGQTVALQVSNLVSAPAAQGVRLLIYRPDAGAITTGTRAYSDVTSGPTGIINLPNLPIDGDYTVLVLPNFGVAASFRLGLLSGAVANVPADGTVRHLETSSDRQMVYFDFTVDPNQLYELTFSNGGAVGGSSSSYSVDFRDSAGRSAGSGVCAAGNCQFHMWGWAPGRYRATVNPNYGGTLHLDATIRKHLTGRVLTKDAPTAFDLALGQVEELSFDANAGETIALQIANVVNAGGKSVRFIVYRPDAGSVVNATRAYTDFTTGPSGLVNLPYLPVAGRYTVFVLPVDGVPASGNLTVVSGAAGTIVPGDAGATFDTRAATQSAYFDFTAGQLDDLELNLTNASVVGASSPQFWLYVYDSVGRQVTGGGCTTTNPLGSCQFHLWALPGGHYRVTVTANYGGVMHFNAAIKRQVPGPLLQRDVPTVLHLAQGEPQRLAFQATSGEDVALKFTDTATVPVGTNVRVIVYRPDAGAITNNTRAYADFSVGASGLVNLPNLPVTGAYRMLVLPGNGLAASSTLTVMSGASAILSPTDGAKSFSTRALDQHAYGYFDIGPGQYLELNLSKVTVVGASTPAFAAYVYDASGRQVSYQTCSVNNAGNSCQLHLWQLSAGRYHLDAWPNYGGTISFDATVLEHTVAAPLVSGVATPLYLPAGKPERFTVQAHAGDNLTLQLSDLVTLPSTAGATFYVYRPDAGPIAVGTPRYAEFTAAGGKLTTLPNLPVDGGYTVLVLPTNGIAATGTITASLAAGGDAPTYQPANLPLDGQLHPFVSDPSPAIITMTFNASLGDNDEVAFRDVQQVGGNGTYTVAVFDPTGVNIDNYTCGTADAGCARNLWNLKAGTYKLIVRATGTQLTLNAVGRPNTASGVLVPGVPRDITRGFGEALRMTFHANVGDTVALRLDNLSSTPAGRYTNVLVYRPDGGRVLDSNAYSSFYSRDNVVLNLPNLPAAGEYLVIVGGDQGVAQSGTLTLFPGAVGTIVSDGAPSHVQASTGAQNVYLTFDTGTGGDFELSFSNGASEGGKSNYFYVTVYSPEGANVGSFPCYVTGSAACTQDLWNAGPGKYTAIVQPQNGDRIHFDAQVRRNLEKGALELGVPKDITHGFGEVLRYKFHAELGDTVALRIDGIASTPAGAGDTLLVFRPDGGVIAVGSPYSSAFSRDKLLLNLPNLPVSGDYTVTIGTELGLAGTGTLTLFPGVTGSTVSESVSQHLQGNTGGQNVYFQVDMGSGGDFALALSGAASEGGKSTYFYVSMFDSDGVNVDNFYCYVTDPACVRDLWNMRAGTYTVVAQPQNGDKIHFDAQLKRNIDRGDLEVGVPKDLSRGFGDILRLKFHGNLGDTVALQLKGVTSTPAGYTTNVMVFRPDGGLVTISSPYSSFAAKDTGLLNLPSLPVSGDYVVTVGTPYGIPSQGTLTLVPGSAGAVVSESVTQHLQANATGQSVYFNVDLGTGGNFEFILDNAVSAGSSSKYFTVALNDPDGVNIGNFYCYVTDPACIYDLWNLRGGVYSAVMTPQVGGTIGADAQLTRNVEIGGMAEGVPKDISHGAMDVRRTSFQAAIGDIVTVSLKDEVANLPGYYTTVSIYRPDVGQVLNNNPYARFYTKTTSSLTLPDLPVSGTYVVIVGTDWGVPSQGTLTFIRGHTP
jgi:YD repeat-containing protein